jgi:ABC-type transport system substrate-binding protein
MKLKETICIALLIILASPILTMNAVTLVNAQTTYLFEITIVAPGSANLLRRQWGLIIANSFQAVGIDARVVFLGWGGVYDRILTPTDTSIIGKTWDEGGYDALLIGWSPGSPVTPYAGTFQIYYSTNTPPNSNYYLWNNSESDAAIDTFMSQGYNDAGIAAFKDWQEIQFEDLPASQIFYTQAVMAADNALDFNGYEWIFDNIGPTPQYLSGMTEVVLSTTGDLLDLNPPLSNSWYDTVVINPIFDSLFGLTSEFAYVPNIATSYTKSPDGRIYDYTIRPGILFHDGVELTADDILFSYLGYLHPATGSQQSAFTAGYIGEDITFNWQNGTTTRLVIDLAGGVGYYPADDTVENDRKATITAVDPYSVRIEIADFGDTGLPSATFHPEGDGLAILPKHVLETVPFSEWKTHTFDTGVGTYEANGQTFSGPIGSGPYVFVSYDSTNALATLEKFDDYWNKTALEGVGMFDVETYYVKYVVGKDSAIADLRNGVAQILDQNYQLQNDYVAGNLDFAKRYLLGGSGLQQMGYNMRHPIFGTGVDTPLGQEDPSQAALAAKYVRQAMDYLIPRQLIIDNLCAGLATPGAVHVNPVSPYANEDIVARDYDPEAAKELLAMAGYNVGVTPPTPETTGSYLLGQTVVVTGSFAIDPVASLEQGGIVALLEMSTDESTWTPVAQTVTTVGGYYELLYTPTATGTYYFRVSLTGVGANTAAVSSATGPTFPYSGLSKSVDAQTTESTQVSVVSLSSQITSATSSLTTQVATLNTQLTTLNSQLSSMTTIAYGGVGLAVVALAVAVVLGMRKK